MGEAGVIMAREKTFLQVASRAHQPRLPESVKKTAAKMWNLIALEKTLEPYIALRLQGCRTV